MIHEWIGQEEELQNIVKNKHCFYTHDSGWPDLEAEVNYSIRDHRNDRICVYKNDHIWSKKVDYSHTASPILLGWHLAVKDLRSSKDYETQNNYAVSQEMHD
jgi:hypothetical protein